MSGAASLRRALAHASPIGPVTRAVTTVALSPVHGMIRKHGYDRTSPANVSWERSMSFTKPLHHQHRTRAQLEPARRIDPTPIRDRYPGLVVPLFWDSAPGRKTPARLPFRMMKAFAHLAGHTGPNLLLAAASWIIAEAMAGCAAYGEALYGIPLTTEAAALEPAEERKAKPGAGMILVHTRDDPASRTPRSHAGLPARCAAILIDMPREGRDRSPWYAPIGVFIAACWRRIRRARERRQTIAELRQLDHRTLRDIGLYACDIEHIARRGVRRE